MHFANASALGFVMDLAATREFALPPLRVTLPPEKPPPQPAISAAATAAPSNMPTRRVRS
jgi:hypothetical protein